MSKEVLFTPENVPKYKGKILDKEVVDRDYPGLYEEVFAKTSEKFGKISLAYKSITNGIDPKNVTGSQFFWNTELKKYLPKNISVSTINDIFDILSVDNNFLKGIYTDHSQLVLYSKDASFEMNQHLLNDLTRKLTSLGYDFSPENPVLITGLKLKKSFSKNNEYGIIFDLDNVEEIKNDSRFASGKDKININGLEKNLLTKNKGAARLCSNAHDVVVANYGNLRYSGRNGRVVLIDAEGVQNSKNFNDKYIQKLEEEKQKEVEKIEERYSKAVKILKGK